MANDSFIPRAPRELVMKTLEQAFRKAAEQDYAYKLTHTEEDLRAATYRYIRQDMDPFPDWRFFLSFETRWLASDGSKSLKKPDIACLKTNEDDVWKQSLEIAVEMKNWPSDQQILDDIHALQALQDGATKFNPTGTKKIHIVFMAILRQSSDKPEAVAAWVRKEIPNLENLRLLLHRHQDIYQGPWDREKNDDPWLRLLR
jgi:hypothetical protein